jgi:hypothetical protein
MCNMNGSASAPYSVTMNGTRCAIKPEIDATSRDKRQSFATTTGAFTFFAFASASASIGRRSRASLPFPLSTSKDVQTLCGGEASNRFALRFNPETALALLAG